MQLEEIQREAGQLSPEEQRKLIGFLVKMDIRRDQVYRDELSRRLDDKDPKNWISLQEVRDEFKKG